MDTVGIWLAAIGTLAVLSFAWRENPAYRFFEHIYIGAAAAHGLVVGVQNLRTSAWNPLVADGKFILIVPIALGILMYTRFIPGKAWISRYPIALVVGLATGMIIRGTITSQFITQLQATLVPFTSLGNIVVVLGTTAVLLFFYFSRERTGALKQYTTFGRWVMMVAFGATFGNAVMGEMTLLIGRLQFLFGDWLHLIH
jgi:hypothetical protein